MITSFSVFVAVLAISATLVAVTTSVSAFITTTGRPTRIANGDLGSGRVSGNDLGSGR